jgi:hypothetical protein
MNKLLNLFLFPISLALSVACTNSEVPAENAVEPTESKDTTGEVSDVTDASSTDNAIPIWTHDYDKSLPQKNRRVDSDTLTAEGVVALINTTKGSNTVRLELKKISKDTAYLKILNSHILTQQMGSTGADDYLSTATFTITELNSVTYVHYDFEPGDHALPGTYSRGYYIKRYESNQALNRQLNQE